MKPIRILWAFYILLVGVQLFRIGSAKREINLATINEFVKQYVAVHLIRAPRRLPAAGQVPNPLAYQ